MPNMTKSRSSGLKRKARALSITSSRKKARTQLLSAHDLPWKTIVRPQEAGADIDEGILELEEIDDVEVVYEETEGGRVAKFNVRAFVLRDRLNNPNGEHKGPGLHER